MRRRHLGPADRRRLTGAATSPPPPRTAPRVARPATAGVGCGTMAYSEILLDVADSVATVTLNRPAQLNAYTPNMGRELHDAFAACDADDEVRAIIVTGAGRGFCAGADLARGGGSFDREAAAEYQRPAPPADRPWAKPPRSIAPWDVRKPIIAAINGPAVGVGATLPLQWDIRIAGESA
ncbi:MAG: hypothetical protein E6J77_26485, partial [Deltaproteobacteria bacterium]